VLCDLASAHEHHPRVADQHRARKNDRQERDDGDRAHDQPVRLQGEQGARAAIDWEGGDDRSFDTPAIGAGRVVTLPRKGKTPPFKNGSDAADIADDAVTPA
jgi:hypothetical protein